MYRILSHCIAQMNATLTEPTPKTEPAPPSWLVDWKSEQETLQVLRQLRPSLHRTTLRRMRLAGKIEATLFAGQWYYKPQSALPQAE